MSCKKPVVPDWFLPFGRIDRTLVWERAIQVGKLIGRQVGLRTRARFPVQVGAVWRSGVLQRKATRLWLP
jgi:hypothetical protein